MTYTQVVHSAQYQEFLGALSAKIHFDPDVSGILSELEPRAVVGSKAYDEADHALLLLIKKSDFFARLSDGSNIGLYAHPDGREFIVSVQDGQGLVIGSTPSNWVDAEFMNPAAFDVAGFKQKCSDAFDLPATLWDEEWPDLYEVIGQ